jgi:hypothetical protein
VSRRNRAPKTYVKDIEGLSLGEYIESEKSGRASFKGFAFENEALQELMNCESDVGRG